MAILAQATHKCFASSLLQSSCTRLRYPLRANAVGNGKRELAPLPAGQPRGSRRTFGRLLVTASEGMRTWGEVAQNDQQQRLLQVVLVSPQIPGNTGCIARTCAATCVGLHLVEPMGFKIEDSKLKRAGLDYWPYVVVKVHKSWNDFFTYFQEQKAEKRLLAFTKKGRVVHTDVKYKAGDWLLFGSEVDGLPAAALEQCNSGEYAGGTVRLPMNTRGWSEVRCCVVPKILQFCKASEGMRTWGEVAQNDQQQRLLQVVLVSPQIPGNTGCIARTCAATCVGLHLVEPMGFKIEDSKLKRAGLDYWPYVVVKVHKSWNDFFTYFQEQKAEKRLLAFTKKGRVVHTDVKYKAGDWLLFGSEVDGLPAAALEQCNSGEYAGGTVRLPMNETYVRSLNLSVSAGIGVYEALRQLDSHTNYSTLDVAPSEPMETVFSGHNDGFP